MSAAYMDVKCRSLELSLYVIFSVVAQEEPGANGTEILNCLKYVRPGDGFEPNFELTVKIDVNGPNEHPLYSFLKVTNALV